MDTAAILVLFALFAFAALSVLLTGADGYRRLTERDAASFDRRTAVQYVATKVRQLDGAGLVSPGSFADGAAIGGDAPVGGDTLFLEETVEGERYVTRIYYYDGYIRELFTEQSAEVSPEDGEPVLAARGLEFSLRRGALTVTATDENGAVTDLTLSERCGRTWADPEGGAAS